MVATNTLTRSVDEIYGALTGQLEMAADMHSVPGQPRKGFEDADTFLAAASRHLNASEDVLVRAAHKASGVDDELVHEYVRASRALESAMVAAKGREYGSAYAVEMKWEDVWADVRDRLHELHLRESALATALEAGLGDGASADLVERLRTIEPNAASRPHPHAPHLGVLGHLARRLLHTVDSFWDTAEGRMVPERARRPHKKPGPLAQYLLGDPRFDEEELD